MDCVAMAHQSPLKVERALTVLELALVDHRIEQVESRHPEPDPLIELTMPADATNPTFENEHDT